MTQPENDGNKAASNLSRAQIRPANSNQRSAIYLSWGGEIYGPASKDDVIAGIRTSYFEEGALYWHEGLEEWTPVCEFPDTSASVKDWRRITASDLPTAPNLPTKIKTSDSSPWRKRHGRPRTGKPASRRIGLGGRAIFFGIAALAVLLIVAILLLLMRI